MLSLADTQARFRGALDSGREAAVRALIAAGPRMERRLAIYQRHHHGSLSRHLCGRFPTVEWLLGTDAMASLASAFAADHLPTAPCMAEYGGGFPAFVAASEPGRRLPYLTFAASLDWLLGQTAVAIDSEPLAITALAGFPPDRLPDLRLDLRPGTRYLAADWPVDTLVKLRLSETVPDTLRLAAEPVRLEVTGARGAFSIDRLDPGTFAFRASLARGHSIGTAADTGLAAQPAFDAGAALAGLFAGRLVTSILGEEK